jgi:hypothetical protein
MIQPDFVFQMACERAMIEAMTDKIEYTVVGFIEGHIVTLINDNWVTL